MNKIRVNLRARGNETMIILVLRDFPIEKRLLHMLQILANNFRRQEPKSDEMAKYQHV